MNCESSHSLAVGLAVFTYSLIEYFLGKKKPFGAGSLLGLIFLGLFIVWEVEKSTWKRK